MLKVILLVVALVFIVSCASFNFRVAWANVKGRYYNDRRLIYFVSAEMATAVAALVAYSTRESWLIKPALASEAAGDNGGLAYLCLLIMGIMAVMIVGATVWAAGTEGEEFWAKKKVIAKR